MICSSFPSPANKLLAWGVNIHHASLFVWGIPATRITQQQKKEKNSLFLYHQLTLRSATLVFET